jgi:aryl-alcohol dehydrogenase-like predicted oxidoreductase
MSPRFHLGFWQQANPSLRSKTGFRKLGYKLQFCLREKRIHGNPIGSLNIEQLEMNARAVSEPLPPDVFERFVEQNF